MGDLKNYFWNLVANQCRQTCINVVKHGPIPQHIGFIMDGNRRFARKLHVKTDQGHRMGFDTLEEILEWCLELGVRVVSVFALSIENFRRPPAELDALMALAIDKLGMLCERSDLIRQHGVAIRVIGNLSLLPAAVRETCERAMRLTSNNKRAILNVCFPYTTRHEMTVAVCRSVRGVKAGQLEIGDIDEELLEHCLFTGGCPDMDILVRTSGELRLSDYMLWQVVDDCKLQFEDALWPELSGWRLLPLILDYQLRFKEIEKNRAERKEVLRHQIRARMIEQIRIQGKELDSIQVDQIMRAREERIAQFMATFEPHQEFVV